MVDALACQLEQVATWHPLFDMLLPLQFCTYADEKDAAADGYEETWHPLWVSDMIVVQRKHRLH